MGKSEEVDDEEKGADESAWKLSQEERARPPLVLDTVCWLPCHSVISCYQPRNCPETSTGLSDDVELLLRGLGYLNYSLDRRQLVYETHLGSTDKSVVVYGENNFFLILSKAYNKNKI